ncbi:Plant self-incompatibility protein S1 family [Raphanus sativus]|nr:Plant self-incompatibility protein S1 family [Raphanus sativus]
MNNLLIVLTFLGLCISLSNGNKVKFSNELEHNKLLKVRCDNDEREHLLKIGEEYEFTFNDDFFHKCAMYQGPNNFEHHQEFTAVGPSTCVEHNTQCNWVAREDGIYFSSFHYPPTMTFEWDVPQLLKT